MKKLILFSLIITLFSCSQAEDDSDNLCTSNCSTLRGRFITMDNVGVEGVKVSLKYIIAGGVFGVNSTRMIIETETDENGNFHKEFYIQDSELGGTADGYFKIDYDDLNLDVTKYILSDNQIGTTAQPLGAAIYSINTRDTIIENTYYLPKKSYIKVNLNNFVPVQDGDYFEVRTYYPFGSYIGNNDLFNSQFATGFSGFGTFRAIGISSILNPFVAENEENIIQIARRTNGVNSIENFLIFVPSNNSIELSYDY